MSAVRMLGAVGIMVAVYLGSIPPAAADRCALLDMVGRCDDGSSGPEEEEQPRDPPPAEQRPTLPETIWFWETGREVTEPGYRVNGRPFTVAKNTSDQLIVDGFTPQFGYDDEGHQTTAIELPDAKWRQTITGYDNCEVEDDYKQEGNESPHHVVKVFYLNNILPNYTYGPDPIWQHNVRFTITAGLDDHGQQLPAVCIDQDGEERCFSDYTIRPTSQNLPRFQRAFSYIYTAFCTPNQRPAKPY
jgi:hypothetical protein